MINISVPTRDEVDSRAQELFDALSSKLGKVPNIYATIGYSSAALESILTFSQAAGDGTFSPREIEAIKLAVSEANGCDYCRAAHTVLAKIQGFTEEETLRIRDGSIAEPRLRVLTSLASEVARNAGKASPEIRERFFELGFDNKALIDFIAVVISVTFTNYVHGLTGVPIDFPEARNLEAIAA
jgi:AhpD family alkylhydroperoxidase